MTSAPGFHFFRLLAGNCLIAAIVVVTTGCSGTARFRSEAPPAVVTKKTSANPVTEFKGTDGIASYYGAKYHGRLTASGERFDMYKFSAAHRNLPFGTRLKVTNLENGRSVIVKVNDRGPFVKNRILDLSYAAAKDLDMLTKGLAKIKMDPVP